MLHIRNQGAEGEGVARGGEGNPPGLPNPPVPWLRRSGIVVLGVEHQLPKYLDKLLLKFNLDNKESTKNHIDKFILAVQTMNVEHEYLVCHFFHLTFEGKASAWYLSLVQVSITNWTDFIQAFLDKFG